MAVPFRLTAAPTFPQGTVLGAYLRREWSGPAPLAGDAPRATAVDTSSAVDAHGFALFPGLEGLTSYYAGAQVNGEWRWASLTTEADAEGSSSSSGEASRLLAPVALSSTTPVTLSGAQTVDGEATNGKRVLVTAQAEAKENGIYVGNNAGAWPRAADVPAGSTLEGRSVAVQAGTARKGALFTLTNAGPVTVGTDGQVWVQPPGVAVTTPAQIGAPAATYADPWKRNTAYAKGQLAAFGGWVYSANSNFTSSNATGALLTGEPANWTLIGAQLVREHVWLNAAEYGVVFGGSQSAATTAANQAKVQAAISKAEETLEGVTGTVSGHGLCELGDPTNLVNYGRVMHDTNAAGGGGAFKWPTPYNKVFTHLWLGKNVGIHGDSPQGLQFRIPSKCELIGSEEKALAGGRAYIVAYFKPAVEGRRAHAVMRDLRVSAQASPPGVAALTKHKPERVDAILVAGAGTTERVTTGGDVRAGAVMRCDHHSFIRCELGGWAKVLYPSFQGASGNNVFDVCGLVSGFCAFYVEAGGHISGSQIYNGHMGFNAGPFIYKDEPATAFVGGLAIVHTVVEQVTRGFIVDDTMTGSVTNIKWTEVANPTGKLGFCGGAFRGDISQPSDAIVKVGSMSGWRVRGSIFQNAGYEGAACCIRSAGKVSDCDFDDISNGLQACVVRGIPFIRAPAVSDCRARVQSAGGNSAEVRFREVVGPASVTRHELLERVPLNTLGLQAGSEADVRRFQTPGSIPLGLALLSAEPAANEIFHMPVLVSQGGRARATARLARQAAGTVPSDQATNRIAGGQSFLDKSTGGVLKLDTTLGLPPTGTIKVVGSGGPLTYTEIKSATELGGVAAPEGDVVVKDGEPAPLVNWPPNKRGAKAVLASALRLGSGEPAPQVLHTVKWNKDSLLRGYIDNLRDFDPTGDLFFANGYLAHYLRGQDAPRTTIAATTVAGQPKYLQVASAVGFPAGAAYAAPQLALSGKHLEEHEGTVTLSFKWRRGNTGSWLTFTTAPIKIWKETVEGIKKAPSGAEIAAALEAAKEGAGKAFNDAANAGASCVTATGGSPWEMGQDGSGEPLGHSEPGTLTFSLAAGATGLMRDLTATGSELGKGGGVSFYKPAIATVLVGSITATYAGVSAAAPKAKVVTATAGKKEITVDDISPWAELGAKQPGAIKIAGTTYRYGKTEGNTFKELEPAVIGGGHEAGTAVEGFPELTGVVISSNPPIAPGEPVLIEGVPGVLAGLSGGGPETDEEASDSGLPKGKSGASKADRVYRVIELDTLTGFSDGGGIVKITTGEGAVYALYKGLLEINPRAMLTSEAFTLGSVPATLGIKDHFLFPASGHVRVRATKTGSNPIFGEIAYTGKATPTTTLAADVTDITSLPSKQLALVSAAGLPASGWVTVRDTTTGQQVEVRYTGITGNTLTGCTASTVPGEVLQTGFLKTETSVFAYTLTGCSRVSGGTGFTVSKFATAYVPTSSQAPRKFLTGVVAAPGGYAPGGVIGTIAAGKAVEDICTWASEGGSYATSGSIGISANNAQLPYFLSIAPVSAPSAGEEEEEPELEEEGAETEAQEATEIERVRTRFAVLPEAVTGGAHPELVSTAAPANNGQVIGGTLLTSGQKLTNGGTLKVTSESLKSWPTSGVVQVGAATASYSGRTDSELTGLSGSTDTTTTFITNQPVTLSLGGKHIKAGQAIRARSAAEATDEGFAAATTPGDTAGFPIGVAVGDDEGLVPVEI